MNHKCVFVCVHKQQNETKTEHSKRQFSNACAGSVATMSSNNNGNPRDKFSGMKSAITVGMNVDYDTEANEVTRKMGRNGMSMNIVPIAFDTQSFSTSSSISTGPVKNLTLDSSVDTGSQFVWTLTDATVLPEFHPLERTAVFVPNKSPSEVASRVSSVLRDRSIQAEFHGSEAKCLTAEGVDFHIFLYRGQKQYGHGIIVEVQRRFGNSHLFYADTQAILDAAEGKPLEPPLKKPKPLPLVEEDQDENLVSSSSLDFVGKLLNHSGIDAQYLAFQTLASLSDCEKMGYRTAEGVANTLLSEDNEVGRMVLKAVLIEGREKDEVGIRLVAMTILCNVVTAVKGSLSVDLQSVLMPMLANELRHAEVTPQMAYIAAKCLAPLLKSGMNDSDLHAALIGARQVGKDKHAGLMEQAELCLRSFEV